MQIINREIHTSQLTYDRLTNEVSFILNPTLDKAIDYDKFSYTHENPNFTKGKNKHIVAFVQMGGKCISEGSQGIQIIQSVNEKGKTEDTFIHFPGICTDCPVKQECSTFTKQVMLPADKLDEVESTLNQKIEV